MLRKVRNSFGQSSSNAKKEKERNRAPQASSGERSKDAHSSTPSEKEGIKGTTSSNMTDNLTLDRKVLLPSKALTLAGGAQGAGGATPKKGCSPSQSPARGSRGSSASPSKTRSSRSSLNVSPSSNGLQRASGRGCSGPPLKCSTKLFEDIDSLTSPEDTLTAIVTPHNTAIIVTLPSSSSPSPTNANKGIRMNQGPTSGNPNTLGVYASIDSGGRIITTPPDSSWSSKKDTEETPIENKMSSPKKLSFIAPPDVAEEKSPRRIPHQRSNLFSVQSKSQPSLHTSSLRSSAYSLYSPYASRTYLPAAVHSSHSKKSKSSPNTPSTLKKHHSFSSVSYNPESQSFSGLKKHSVPVTSSSTMTVSTRSRKGSYGASKTTTTIRKYHSFCSSYHNLQHSSLSCPSRYSHSVSPSGRSHSSGHRSHPVSPKRKASSVYMAVSSCICCRIRNQDGSGLTIRIPRPQSDRGSSPPLPSTSPPPVPRYAQLTTSRYAHMAPLPHSGSAPVPKSKSLSTSMDKLSLGHHHDKLMASGHPQPPVSRGSTPSSGRSSAGGPSRPPSRRSPAAQQKTSRIIDGAIEKSDSPCGSEISLNSGVSSSASVKSLKSVRSSSSASGRSSTELPRTSQPRSSKSQTPTRSTPVRTSSTNSSIRSSRSSTPPDSKQSTATLKATISAANGNARGSRSPIVATHRKNAVSSRITGINGTSPTHNTDSLKRRTVSTSSVSSSSTPATGPRKMSMATSDSRGSGLPQQGSPAETTKKGLPIFNSYMSLFQVQEKLKKGEVIEGVLRINPKNYEDAYISAPGGGTDIYIGGVRDRNAALHGDLVAIELLSPQHWKVLYDQLDYFLDCDDTLKSLVYAAHDPFAVMDQFVPPDSVAPKKQQQNKEELQQATNINNTSNNAITSDDNSGTVNTESCDAGSAKKKKGRRRGKKNKKKEKLESVDEDGTGMVNAAAEEVVAGLLSGDPPYQNVQDELILLSSNVGKAGQGAASDEVRPRKGAKQAIIVPPDMLSECSDVTDDESCCSDSLDLDAAHEDHAFFTAQRAAARRAKKFAEGATVKLVGPSAEEASVSSTGGVKIVEITDDVEVPAKNETVSDQSGSNTGSTLVKSEGDTKDGASDKSEQESIKNEQQKKRLTAAERLFGDKAKKSKKNRSKNSKATLTEEIESGIVTLAIGKETKNSKGSDSKACSVDDCKSTEVAPQEHTQAKSEFAAYSFDDQSMQQAVNSAPPRFMISPYNQQINYSASNSRAQNNWLNHPMLNNFTNTPNPQPMAYQSGNQRPSQQQHHYGQQRQQQEQQQQYGSRQQQTASDSSKRTDPSVEQVMRLSNWGRFVQKVGYVVHILEHRNTRLGAGTLKPFADMNRSFALFSPKDSRIPRMKIPMSQCPSDLFPRRNEYAKRIYLAKITLWNDPKFALGELVRDIGRHGDIMAESEAFLLEIGIDYSEFPQEVLLELPVVPEVGWSIPEEAKAGRMDLRDRCIFSVDPATARDLDDALSCESLPGDRYRVGVHIADVSYFFPAGSELDKFAAGRATSVYLVDKVIPMLPRVLCEQLCSLNPDEDRLAFSVIWEMDRTGQIQSTWFGRTIIRSCAKLSYDHAQLVIDSPGKVDWEEHEMPPISRFPLSQVCQTITALQGLAVHMRARRHRNGALRLDQSKLAFSLDRETKMPNAVTTTEHKLSNNLIEEFMLLANISVAHKIYESFPTKAVLRCHPEPQVGPLADTVNMLRCMNIEIDISSAGSIYESILQLTGDSDFSPAQLEVVVNMLSKPMQNALYFCSGSYLEDFSHYALNVPFYTHFTSPIRRYPDIMVHRLLASAIDPEQYPLADLSLDEMDRRLSVSNEKKTSAKRASEYSCELYLAEFVRQLREIHTSGIVLGVLDRSLDILLLDYCTIKRTYLEKLPLEALNYDNKSKNEPPSLHVVWSPDHKTQSPSIAQSFTYFTPVKVVLTPFTNDQLKFNVTLVRPES